MSHRVHESAFTTLTLVLSLLVSALCASIALHALQTSSRAAFFARKVAQAVEGEARVVSLMDQMMRRIDQHPLPLYPSIQRGSSATLVNKKQNSDAISYVDLSALHLYQVEQWRSNTESLSTKICPFGVFHMPVSARSLLAFTADGYFELTLPKRRSFRGNKCIEIDIKQPATSHIPGALQTLDPRFSSILIPLRSIYTLYLDTNNTLRLIQYSGTKRYENQPLVEGVDKLNFHASTLTDPTLYSLHMKLKFAKKSFDMNFTHHITRTHYQTFLFWATQHAKT